MYLDKRLEDDKDYGLSLFKLGDEDCIKWLDTKETGSVVYVSFGSLANLGEDQMEELACGLKQSNRYFLWVVRASEESKLPTNFATEASEKGRVVNWCPQLKVLAHPATGWFMTHCGWNSTMEALSLGVPMVAVPQWADQPTNAKYIVDIWQVGVRVKVDEKGMIRREEIELCMREVMEGERGNELKRNAVRWKEFAKEAVGEAQGHINPLVQFSKRLASKGLKVTLVVTKKSLQSQDSSIKVEHIADFLEDSNQISDNVESFINRFRVAVSRGLRELIEKQNSLGCPVKIVVYDSSMPWVLDIAHELGLYGAVFSTQSCAVGAVYYHMYKGSLKNIGPVEGSTVSLPSMPLMETKDLSSFIYDMGSYPSMLRLVVNQFSNWEKADWRLFNTFDKLEGGKCVVTINAVDGCKGFAFFHIRYGHVSSFRRLVLDRFSDFDKADWLLFNSFDKPERKVVNWMASQWPVKTVGPTIPSMYLDKRLEDDRDYDLSLFKPGDDDCIRWLDTKETGSVVYVSFGSLANLKEDQMEELACGLKRSNRYFLWVVRASEESKLPTNFSTEASENGLVVNWCPQLKVLAHPAMGCFMTHCGWNSILEALSLGVPMLAVPQWTDQPTNAKYVVDIWQAGVRVKVDEKGMIRREEIETCIREVMEGERGNELKRNAVRWKELAKAAVDEGGSSDKHIDEFISELACN
ncbi:hypothetical protein RJ640_029602 [Escallonia rubra]|uniref:Uncharacterized protein n=1 Tax=Escallonia rubra TaxID=112253 RepID=A0AA88S4G5_9ASTE|nr:hypothetical protein RJ640_029602 [Escallonia rubra]